MDILNTDTDIPVRENTPRRGREITFRCWEEISIIPRYCNDDAVAMIDFRPPMEGMICEKP